MSDRIEVDTLGEVRVPQRALWGAQTQRAVDNGIRVGSMPMDLIRSLALIKKGAAIVNEELGLISAEIAEAIGKAADEVLEGRWDDQFPLSPFQTGSGTSTNMNLNEVIANRANELLGGKRGAKHPVHPNDHVNRCQSSNDVFPTALHLAAGRAISGEVLEAARGMESVLRRKSEEFAGMVKLGRTHLMDAVPVSVGQEFGGYAQMVHSTTAHLRQCSSQLNEVPLGGTAVGTGLNAHPEFAARTIDWLSEQTGLRLCRAQDPFEAQGARTAVLAVSGALRGLAVALSKIANDLRWLASGPNGGLGELRLPALQPGSSIMPGKVNPVVPEAVIQAAAQVVASDVAVVQGAQGGVLELNLMMPLLASNLLLQTDLLTGACRLFAERCVTGIQVDAERCRELVEKSGALVTPLARLVGYDRASHVAKEAQHRGVTLLQVSTEMNLAPEEELRKILDPATMVGSR